MREFLKKIAARLPLVWQQDMKRIYFRWQIGRGAFRTDEKEFGSLGQMVSPGDWVLDIGANIGHYTAHLSDLVGPSGRVVAFEPVPATFELLAANVARLRLANVSLVNAAASDSSRVVGMSVPKLASGLSNYYMANVGGSTADISVLAFPVDGLHLSGPVKLVKIDAEGHEMSVLEGMSNLLRRDRPILIIEESSPRIGAMLAELGYLRERLPGSSNAIYRSAPDHQPIPR